MGQELVMGLDWAFVFLGLAVGAALGAAGAAAWQRLRDTAGEPAAIKDFLTKPAHTQLTPTLSEVQQAYVATFSHKLRGHDSVIPDHKRGVKDPKRGTDEAKAALADTGVKPDTDISRVPARQDSYLGKFMSWSLEHAPSALFQGASPDPPNASHTYRQQHRHHEEHNLPGKGLLKRTLTAAELADTLSSPDSFERVALEYKSNNWETQSALESTMSASAPLQHPGKAMEVPGVSKVPQILSFPSDASRSDSPRIMVWRSTTRELPADDTGWEAMPDDTIFAEANHESGVPQMGTSENCTPSDNAVIDSRTPPGHRQVACVTWRASGLSAPQLEEYLQKASFAILLNIEQIMPRPKAGLLKRMFRLAKVAQVSTGASNGPVLLMQDDAEYHIGLQLITSPLSERTADLLGVQWVSLAPKGAIATGLEVERVGQDKPHWTGGCVWQMHTPGQTASQRKGVLPLDLCVSICSASSKEVMGGHQEDLCASITLEAACGTCDDDTWQPYDVSPLLHALTKAWRLPENNVFEEITDILLMT